MPDSPQADGAPEHTETATPSSSGKVHKPLKLPSQEEMMQEDIMNNCAVKSVISGIMGGLLGVAFGIFTASMDTSGVGVSVPRSSEMSIVETEALELT